MTLPLFFRIPRELRNRIYHFALHNVRVTFYVANFSLDVKYGKEDDPYELYASDKLRWLLSSRQVLSEGLNQFYMHAELKHHSIWTHNPINDLTLDGATSIFDLGRIKAADLHLQMGKTYCGSGDESYNLIVPRGKERFDGIDEDFTELGKLIKSIGSNAFEELSLTVYLFRTSNETKNYEDTGNRFIVNLGAENDAGGHLSNDGDDTDDADDDDSDAGSDGSDGSNSYTEGYWNGYGTNLTGPDWVSGYIVDFDFLENLGTHWKCVQIEYIPTFMMAYWGDEDPVPANIVAVPIIQEGLCEIAKVLVGGKGWAVRDSLAVDTDTVRWSLHAERKSTGENFCQLDHVGLRHYLAECVGCSEREEMFTLQCDEEDGIIRFMGERCGRIVEVKTPVVGREM